MIIYKKPEMHRLGVFFGNFCLLLLFPIAAVANETNAEILEELRALKERVGELEQKLEQAEQKVAEHESGPATDENNEPQQLRVIQIEDDEGAGGIDDESIASDSDMDVVDTDMKELASTLETRILLGSTYRSEVEDLVTTKAQQVYAQREAQKAENTIRVHGALRTQFSFEDFNAGNRDRGGDFDFDTFRINLDGAIGDVLLSGEYRFYQYMDVIHHGWVGYNFTDKLQGQVGIHQVPFGVLPFNSHNYFFSSNYYLGLEDDYDMGVKFIYDDSPWNLQAAFYKNDEQGGVDGFVDNRADRYSYDVVGGGNAIDGQGNLIGAQELGETNTFNARAAYRFEHAEDHVTEIGVSGQYGDLHDGTNSVGDNHAYAIHLDGFYDRWNVQLQAARQEYDLDSGADVMTVGAYSFFDTIPAETSVYTANVSYSKPVNFGPVSNVTFYNDYSLVTDKPANLDDTWMNVTGFSLSAGGLFAYFDFVMARNQPFIGGSLAGDDDGTNSRFNINLGYYF
ncbi:hypothetical protein J2T55_000403 [Methylohalomonas lacus]|uniref:Carbohydrate porin n=1 Tax=Methylohalomonas lacus TaxID=398773 RepID=A0AAE3HK75_9GAMM|nr:carbohydrate porin [Methylohalomonas lacus]MCS3902407.1 hypothetical protein [Methylohalomonas lacus]